MRICWEDHPCMWNTYTVECKGTCLEIWSIMDCSTWWEPNAQCGHFGSQTGSIRHMPENLLEIRNSACASESLRFCFYQDPQVIPLHITVWNHFQIQVQIVHWRKCSMKAGRLEKLRRSSRCIEEFQHEL